MEPNGRSGPSHRLSLLVRRDTPRAFSNNEGSFTNNDGDVNNTSLDNKDSLTLGPDPPYLRKNEIVKALGFYFVIWQYFSSVSYIFL